MRNRLALPVAVIASVLAGPASSAAPPRSVDVRYPDATTLALNQNYLVRIEPDAGVRGVPNLTLVLWRKDHRAKNLLEPRGNWHGAEPFMFLAHDFAGQNRQRSRSERLLPIAGTGEFLAVAIREAKLGPGGNWKGGRLTLRVSLRLR
jgi:hypothetical protein